MSKRSYLIMIHAGAFWPAWVWCCTRMVDRSDEPWGVIALLTMIVFVVQNRLPAVSHPSISLPPLIIALLYIALFPITPPLAKALLAITSIAFLASHLFLNRTFHFGLLGLAFLSLPIMASLQFYLGFPIRLLTTKLVATGLTLVGYPTVAMGTCLQWAGEFVAIDAPCSGIKLLWCALYLAFTLATFKNFSFRKTWIFYVITSFLVFVTNAIRTFILFFFEAGILPRTIPQYHAGVGLILSTLLIALLLFISTRLGNTGKVHYA